MAALLDILAFVDFGVAAAFLVVSAVAGVLGVVNFNLVVVFGVLTGYLILTQVGITMTELTDLFVLPIALHVLLTFLGALHLLSSFLVLT